MRTRYLGLVTTALLFAPSFAPAQSGMLNRRTQYAMMHGPGLSGAPAPLVGIILWRGEPNWMSPRDDIERQKIDSIMELAVLDAKAQQRSAFGSGNAYGMVDKAQRTVNIEGRDYDVSRHDSVLVIMVTVLPKNMERSVATARISSVAAPDVHPKFVSKAGKSVLVQVPLWETMRLLNAYLQRSPVVAAFLR